MNLPTLRRLIALMLDMIAALLVQLEQYPLILMLLLVTLLLLAPDMRSSRVIGRGTIGKERTIEHERARTIRYQYAVRTPQPANRPLPACNRIPAERSRLQAVSASYPHSAGRHEIRRVASRHANHLYQPTNRLLQQGARESVNRSLEVIA